MTTLRIIRPGVLVAAAAIVEECGSMRDAIRLAGDELRAAGVEEQSIVIVEMKAVGSNRPIVVATGVKR
jgi:hypothetical protein